MCGIFAYSGSRPVDQTLIKGLKKLQYRGYDSSGIAFFNNNSIESFRVCGDVSELENQISQSYGGGLGIGHTRWATHGKPTKENAHPHQSSCIYIVHNGVIENEDELRKKIKSENLTSETDSELIAHLIFDFYKESQDFLQSVLKVANLLEGSYAVAVICSDKPNEMIAFKNGPPLMLCEHEKEIILSSDMQAAADYAKAGVILEDEELIHLDQNNYKFYNFKGEPIEKKHEPWIFESGSAEKGGYPHFMLKEIFEQPYSVGKCLSSHIDKSSHELKLKLLKGDIQDLNSHLGTCEHLLILGCGSSYYTGLFAKYFIESMSHIKVDVEIASEFIYRKSFIPKNTMVLFVSQSGETADILTAYQQVQQQNLKTISLCNTDSSSLVRKTDYTLFINANQEVAVASTKTFSNSIVSLMLLGLHIAKIKKQLPLDEERKLMKQFLSLPMHIENALNSKRYLKNWITEIKKFSGFFYLGRNLYYPMALEGALKLKEIAYLHAEAYPAGEMKHGPLAMIDQNMLVIFLIPSKTDPLYQKTITNLKEAKARGAHVMAIGDCSDPKLQELCSYNLRLRKTNFLFSPMLTLFPLQLIAYYLSVSYDYDPDKPKNLAKSVTVE